MVQSPDCPRVAPRLGGAQCFSGRDLRSFAGIISASVLQQQVKRRFSRGRLVFWSDEPHLQSPDTHEAAGVARPDFAPYPVMAQEFDPHLRRHLVRRSGEHSPLQKRLLSRRSLMSGLAWACWNEPIPRAGGGIHIRPRVGMPGSGVVRGEHRVPRGRFWPDARDAARCTESGSALSRGAVASQDNAFRQDHVQQNKTHNRCQYSLCAYDSFT